MKNSSANELIKKEVEFQGSKILGIMENGKVYVSVKAVGKNLGMNEHQINSQRQKIQTDTTLNMGCVKFHAGSFDLNNQTLAIELDYLPIWLAKINPSRFNNELKQKLLTYQLKAKDVLAEAFLGKRTFNNKSIKDLNYEDTIFYVKGILNNLKSQLIFEKTEIEMKLKELENTGLTDEIKAYVFNGKIQIIQDL